MVTVVYRSSRGTTDLKPWAKKVCLGFSLTIESSLVARSFVSRKAWIGRTLRSRWRL